MLNADRRGVISGSEEARKYQQQANLQEEEIRRIGVRVYMAMKNADYAHVDPMQDFIRGFVEGFQLFFLQPLLKSPQG